jgi:hypothetical protein
MRIRATVLSLFAVATVAGPQPLSAQGQNPSIAGHTFVPNTVIDDPFVTTHFRSLVGLASAFGYTILEIPTADSVIDVEGEMTWVLVEWEYRQKVADWLSLNGSMSGGARVGTNTAAAIADGVSVITAFELGGLARLFETERIVASANFDARYSGLTLLSVVEFVREVIDSVESGGPLDSISLSSKKGALQARGGLRLAYAPAPLVGFTFQGEVGVGEDYSEIGATSVDLTVGGTVGINLRSIDKFPTSRSAWRSSGKTRPSWTGMTCRSWDSASGPDTTSELREGTAAQPVSALIGLSGWRRGRDGPTQRGTPANGDSAGWIERGLPEPVRQLSYRRPHDAG